MGESVRLDELVRLFLWIPPAEKAAFIARVNRTPPPKENGRPGFVTHAIRDLMAQAVAEKVHFSWENPK